MRSWLGGIAVLLLALVSCARPQPASHDSAARGVRIACSGWNPSQQTAITEAVVLAGGPRTVAVAGWSCGESSSGIVRIIFLRFRVLGDEVPSAVVPVVFENGYALAFGWTLFEQQPDRYGESIDVRDWGPPTWRTPSGWVNHHTPEQPLPPAPE